MKAPAAIVASVFEGAIREINALEGRIVAAEDDADEMLWQQAADVVAQLDAGLTQRKLAAQWINQRTGEEYSAMHVNYTRQVVVKFTLQDPRPRFRDAYNAIANATGTEDRRTRYTGDFEWYTPAVVVEAARAVLGGIDLDPASSARANDVVQATRFYTAADDGLAQTWEGRVWLNPPYASAIVAQFADKLAASVEAGTVPAAIVIVNNATDTRWFRTLEDVSAAICFPTGRVQFWKPDQAADSPVEGQAVFYAGPAVDAFHAYFGPFGPVWGRL